MAVFTGLALILGTAVVCTVGIWKTKQHAKVIFIGHTVIHKVLLASE